PFGVSRPGPVTRLARDVHVGPARLVDVGGRGIALLETRRMALRAHVVPVACRTRPVKDVVRVHVLAGLKVEPALTTLGRRTAVPGHRESLESSPRKRHEELLQGLDAERVRDRVLVNLPVGTVSRDDEAVAL